MNATTDNGGWQNRQGATNRSAAELEREGEEIRADLDRTLDEIERKLSPGELLDRSVEFFRDNGSEFLAEAGETVRRNPVPVLLTAAGLVWLTASIAKSRSSSGQDYGRSEYGRSSYGREEYGSEGAYTGRRSGSSSGGLKSKVSDTVHAMKDRTRGVMSSVHDRTQGVMSSMHERTDGMKSTLQDRAQDARSTFVQLVQEQPVALGALALATGALLGAAFPITQYENRLVGPVHDRTMARAKEVGQREYEKLREAVTSSFSKEGNESGSGRTRQASTSQNNSSPLGASGASEEV